MRLVIDGRRLTAERTGVGRYLEVLLGEWSRTGAPLPETLVMLAERAGLARVPFGSGILAEVAGEGWPGLAWERWALGRRLGPGDILFATANLVPSNWRGRTLLVVHDTLIESIPASFSRLTRWRFAARYRRASARADRILTPSETTRADVLNHHRVDPARVGVVYPSSDGSFRPLGPMADAVLEARARVGLGSAPFFLFVGKPSARRNVPAILDAFRRHRSSHPEHRLVFVGPGRKAIADSPGSDPSILEAGHVSEPVLRGLMADALALLYPSEYEGFGLPIIEAMASGCPVITLRRGAMIEAGGDAAWYLDRAEPAELAAAMAALADRWSVRISRIARGFHQAEKFTPARFAAQVADEVRALAGHRSAIRPPRFRDRSARRGRGALHVS